MKKTRLLMLVGVLLLSLALVGMALAADSAQKPEPQKPNSMTLTAPGGGQINSLSGSFVAFDPAAGGEPEYIPSTPQTVCFRGETYTTDWGYVYNLWMKFPTDWTVDNAYVVGTPACDAGSFGTFSWSFQTEPYEVNIYHPRYQATTDHCVAYYCFDVVTGAGPLDAPVSWYWNGDDYGAPPYHPCSNDGYTPSDQITCDESVNPTADIPIFEPLPIMLTPPTQEATGCTDAGHDYVETVWNFTGYDTNVDLSYTIIAGSGSCSGPASVFLEDETTTNIDVTLVPSGIPGDVVQCQVYAVDELNPDNNATAVLSYNVISGGIDPAGWQLETNVDTYPAQWQACSVGTYPGVAGDVGYHVGGLSSANTVQNYLQMYDPHSEVWTQLATAPLSLMGQVAGWIDGKLYVAGGVDAGFIGYTDLAVYDPVTNTWDNTTPAELPLPRGGASGGVAPCHTTGVGECLYLLGGTPDGTFTNFSFNAYEYDPANNLWTQLTSIPGNPSNYGTAFGAGTACEGKVYVGGDYRGVADFFVYDPLMPSGSEWTQLASIPSTAGKMTVATACNPNEDAIYFIGGDSLGYWGDTYNNKVFRYYINTNTWDGPLTQTLNQGLLGSCGMFMDNKLWTFGGTNGAYAISPAPHESLAYLSCGPAEGAEIEITPPSLFASQEPGQITTQVLNIGNIGTEDLVWELTEGLPVIGWSENFDEYPPDTDLFGLNGWKGWANSPGATAFTTDDQAFSTPNSVDINGNSDLVHEYFGYTSGTWVYSAKQYVPSGMVGQSYFILLNQYDDAGVTNNWSTQVYFDYAAGTVVNTGIGAETLPLITDQWVDISVVIDLDNDVQTFYYGGDVLYTGSWKEGISGGGIANIAAVDLFANLATTVYYDDIALWQPGADVPWLSESPSSGTTPPGGSVPVDVTFNSTGLGQGIYTATLFALSNDVDEAVVEVPVTLEVTGGAPVIRVDPTSLYQELFRDQQADQTLQVCNDGNIPLDWTIAEVGAGLSSKNATYSANLNAKPVGGFSPNLGVTGTPKAVPSASNPDEVLWDQYANFSGTTMASQDFEAAYDVYDIYAGDDFENPDGWTIEKIVTRGGWTNPVDLHNATALHWYIYADNPGKPVGFPGDGLEFWSLTLAPTDPQVALGVNEPEDVVLTLDVPISLPPGHWWLVFFPSLEYTLYGQYGWSSTTDAVKGYVGEQANPGGGFGIGTDWVANTYGLDYMFRLEGNRGFDLPWLTEDPIAGTTLPGECSDVLVTFNSNGLDLGVYEGGLDIGSNDPTTPLVNVPVTLNVTEPDIVVTAPPLEMSLFPGESDSLNFTIENVGTSALDWSVADGATWLSEFPVDGTILPGDPATGVDVTFDASLLTPGEYTTDVVIASNDPDMPEVVLPATLTVLPFEADLSIEKTANTAEARVGDTITYTLVVSNTGPELAMDVEVVDTLPAEVTFVDASAGCTEDAGVVTCLLGDLEAGEDATVTIVVTAAAEGVAENVAEVSSLSEDPVPANNTSTADVTILPAMYYFYLPIIQKG